MRLLPKFLYPRSQIGRVVKVVSLLVIFCTLVYELMHLPLSDIWRTNIKPIQTSRYFEFSPPEDRDEAPDNGNQARPACVFPQLKIDHPDIMKFYVKYPRLRCKADPDWMVIHNGSFIITEEANRTHPGIKCDVFPIVKVTDFKTKEEEAIRDVKNGTAIKNDFYRVYCSSTDNSTYKNYLAGVSLRPGVLKREKRTNSLGLDMDVVILGLDSTSHQAYHRHLPLTTNYILNELKGIEMNGYNILGDGTPAAIMPILLGHIEEELHEARRGYNGATVVDDFPWIWKEFRKAGYVVTYSEDDAYLGTFQYRLLGFENQPTDHYLRYFCVAAEPHYGDYEKHCQGSRPRHDVVLDYMRQIFNVYPQQRKWMFSFQSQLSHSDNNFLSLMDDDLLAHLDWLRREKHLDNAILILMADHGGRFSKVRATEQGKQEERLPYLAFVFPQWFHEKHPAIIKNLKTNSQRLTTPFDVHETLHEILHFTGTGRANITNRGVSLFKEIPLERDCTKARIDTHWCSCLDWKSEDTTSEAVTKAAATIISTFNNYTASYRNLCSVLTLDKVVSASSYRVKDAVLKLKTTNDGGRGRFGPMTDTTKLAVIMYQVTLIVQPGGGRFEVTISHNIKTDVFTISPKDISRVNKYGKNPHCVEHTDSFQRPYCFCKDLLKSYNNESGSNAKQST